MKKVFSHDNLITFAFVVTAVTVAALVVIPLAKKFVPASLLPGSTTTTTTAAPTS